MEQRQRTSTEYGEEDEVGEVGKAEDRTEVQRRAPKFSARSSTDADQDRQASNFSKEKSGNPEGMRAKVVEKKRFATTCSPTDLAGSQAAVVLGQARLIRNSLNEK